MKKVANLALVTLMLLSFGIANACADCDKCTKKHDDCKCKQECLKDCDCGCKCHKECTKDCDCGCDCKTQCCKKGCKIKKSKFKFFRKNKCDCK